MRSKAYRTLNDDRIIRTNPIFHSMPRPAATPEHQLRRQLSWLGQSWGWLMRNRVISRTGMTALDVGCGPGLVMELLSPWLEVTGADIDPEMVRRTCNKGMRAVVGDAMDLPFHDQSFDVVYCSFTMIWVRDPQRAIGEMARLARSSVVCLAEPDYGGRVCFPEEVAELDAALIGSLQEEGADPLVGGKIASMMERAGLEVESGVHSGAWSPTQMRSEAEAEWLSLSQAVQGRVDGDTLVKAKKAWDAALAKGTLSLFNPVHSAIGRKR